MNSAGKRGWAGLGLAQLVSHTAGLIGAAFGGPSGRYCRRLNKPPYSPPPWIFPVVWPVLYTLMGFTLHLVAGRGLNRPEVHRALVPFSAQWMLNALWMIVFFGLKSPLAALAEIGLLWASILATLREFGKVSRPAAWLLAPYLAWITFAWLLNFEVWRRNR